MNFIVVGTNHKYSPIHIREKFSFSQNEINAALMELVDGNVIEAAVIVSTCNRTEIYAATPDAGFGISYLEKFLGCQGQYLYGYVDKDAVRHLFSVAAGIDSQIVGEGQILQQIKNSYDKARFAGATDGFIDEVFDRALKVAVKVKNQTKISDGDISVASVIADFIKWKNILVIGTGKVSELLVPYINKEGSSAVFVANKTFDRAVRLAESVNGRAIRFCSLKNELLYADVVISATSSPHFILTKEDLSDVKRSLLIIDLALPRDVDPAVKDIEGICLLTLDGLDFIIEAQTRERKKEIPKALDIIEEATKQLWQKEFLKLAPEPALLP